TVQVAAPQLFGKTPLGERRVVQILRGRLEGKLSGEVLPGGADWQIIAANGVAQLEARYTVRTAEGALILVQNRGIRHAEPAILEQLYAGELVDPANYYFRSTPSFETGENSYAWLNRIVAVCSGARTPTEVLLDFYEIL
ncbi:MAG TPA: DUF3237 domain-containing protein, partial [Terriglobia bacterium]|nr:DUF3237 domain-containing protein [Terriglobia bacterium]